MPRKYQFKKVFSLLQYVRYSVETKTLMGSDFKIGINVSKDDMWQECCEGKTLQEITKLGYIVEDSWMTTRKEQQALSLEDTRKECRRLIESYKEEEWE